MFSKSFCWGLKEKYSFFENIRSSLEQVCSELHREEPSSQHKLSLQKQCSLGPDLSKAVNRRVPYISVYCSISSSTVRPVWPWDAFLLFLKINIFYFHETRQVEFYIASNVCPKRIFTSVYSDIKGLSRSQVYSRNFIVFFYHHLMVEIT